MDEKNKTSTLRFSAKENPNMEKALFDWPIVLQYDVKAIVQFRIKNYRWTQTLTTHSYRVSLDVK